MERRKLFSENSAVVTTRRKLFSNEEVKSATVEKSEEKKFSSNPNSNFIPNETGKSIIICSDCGKAYYYDGSTTNLICPNCGGLRFNYVDQVLDLEEKTEGETAVDKVFSEKRRQLFSNDSDKSKFTDTGICSELPKESQSSLTNETHTEDKTLYVCSDCDYEFAAEEDTTSNVICPKCGGSRVQLNSQVVDDIHMEDEPKSDEIGEYLEENKGKTLEKDIVDNELSERGFSDRIGGVQGLIDAGYVTEQEGNMVKFSDVAGLQYKLFSELVISVSKEFSVTPIQNKESAIESLSGRLSEKCMSALKKANKIEEHKLETVNFSDKDYINDSGIENDLSAEYGGTSMKLKDFMNLLSTEYPDAPDHILDLLVNDKVIKITGSQVEIRK